MVGWRIRLAKVMIAVGGIGFFICWSIGWSTESRVFSDPVFASKSPTRTEAVEVKGEIYYLEPSPAWQFKASHTAIMIFFTISILGGAYVERRKRESKK